MATSSTPRINTVTIERAENGGFIVYETDWPGAERMMRGRRWAFSPHDTEGREALVELLLVTEHNEETEESSG